MVCYTRDSPHPPPPIITALVGPQCPLSLNYNIGPVIWKQVGGVLTWRYGYWPCLMKLLIIRPCRTGVLSLFPWRTWEGTEGGHVMTRVHFLIRGKYRIHKLRANVCWRTVIIVPMWPSMVVGDFVSSCLCELVYTVLFYLYWWFTIRGA